MQDSEPCTPLSKDAFTIDIHNIEHSSHVTGLCHHRQQGHTTSDRSVPTPQGPEELQSRLTNDIVQEMVRRSSLEGSSPDLHYSRIIKPTTWVYPHNP